MPTAIAPSPAVSPRVQMTARQRACLEQIARRQTSPQRLVRRVKILLALEMGANQCHVTRQMRLNRGTVYTWRRRWLALAPKLEQIEADGGHEKVLTTMIVEALTDHPRSGTPATFTAEQIVQMVAVACEDPTDSGRPISHWTPREVADEVRKRGIVETISTRSVGRFLKSGDLQPHRVEYWLNAKPDDPVAFADQVAAVCEAYQHAPAVARQGGHVISTDEKTGIQALERAAPTLPMKPGLVERPEYEYLRHGTQCLIANFDVATGEVVAPTVGPSRTEEDFAGHIAHTIGTDPEAPWLFIVDQLNTHKSEALVRLVAEACGIKEDLGEKEKRGILQSMPTRAEFLSDVSHRIRFLYTPKHTSWLNQIELWFSILVRRLLKRGNFTSVEDLRERILAFIAYFNKTMAKPFKWTYKGRPLTV